MTGAGTSRRPARNAAITITTQPVKAAESTIAEPIASEPTVGVVVPAFQAGRYLASTLGSIRAQSFTRWTCVIVDDGSSDDTAAIAQGFADDDPRFQLVRQPNAGVAAARNTGIDGLPPSVGWIAFIDSDDALQPDALTTLLAQVTARPDAAGAFGFAEYMDSAGDPIRPGEHRAVQWDRRRPTRWDIGDLPPEADVGFDSLVVSGTIWPPSTGLFRRDLLERVGRFDPEQGFAEDWDLWIRMSRSGPFVPIDHQISWYRQHDSNLTGNSASMAAGVVQVRIKALDDPANTRRERRLVKHVWVRLQLRWVLWSGIAAVRAASARDFPRARRAGLATVLFLRDLARGRPRPLSASAVAAVVEFVEPASAGAGFSVRSS